MKKLLLFLLFFCWVLMLTLFSKPTFGENPNPLIVVVGLPDSALIHQALRFYAQQLQIEHVHIRVMAAQEMPQATNGCVLYQETLPDAGPQALVKIRVGMDTPDLLQVLAHEMVHIKQYAHKELVHCEAHQYSWRGTTIADIRKIAYAQRAWEKEAIQQEMALLLAFWKQSK